MQRVFPIVPQSVMEASALIKYCSILVSNDTGLLHVGAALQVPTVSVFMVTSPQRYAPRGSQHHAFKNTAAKPVMPQDVYEKVLELKTKFHP
jgi:ADP-heptose:LPS heptosyltransferase